MGSAEERGRAGRGCSRGAGPLLACAPMREPASGAPRAWACLLLVLAGVAGTFWSVYAPTDPEVGWRALLWTFAASILGGFVSIYGTIAGGYIVGASENFGITALYYGYGVDISYKPMIALVIIVAVFLIRPTGFAGLTLRDFIDGVRKFPKRIRERGTALVDWVKGLVPSRG